MKSSYNAGCKTFEDNMFMHVYIISCYNFYMLVSLIIPIYNVSAYLPKLLETTLSQTHTELEIILINDGSTDSSGKICNDYANIDRRIKVINKTNSGVSDARNVGIEASTGDYLVFADGDDYLANDYVEYLLNLCVDYDADISVCAWSYDDGSRLKKCNYRKREPGLYSGKQEAMRALLTTRLMSSSSCGKMYKRTLFEKIRFPSGMILYEDDAIMYRLVAQANSVVIGKESKYFYRQRNDSASHRPFDDDIFTIIKVYEERCRFIETEYPYLALYARSDILMVVNHCITKMCDEKLYQHPSIKGLKIYYKNYEKDFLKGISYFPAKFFSIASYINIPLAMRLYSLTGKHSRIN